MVRPGPRDFTWPPQGSVILCGFRHGAGSPPMLRMLLAALLLLPAFAARSQDLKLFIIGSGEVGGGYFAATSAICEGFNRTHRGLRCSPEPTNGSRYNLAALATRQIDFAMVQSDWQRAAVEGSGAFAGEAPMAGLRSVTGLYPEAITVLARRDAGITSIDDIAGRKIDVGHPASGRRTTVMRLLDALGYQRADFAAVLELPTGGAIAELCAGRIDLTILITGHPSATVGDALRRCGAQIVPLDGARLEGAFASGGDYVPTLVARQIYPELPADVATYAVIATVVTRDDMPDDLVEALVGNVITTLPELRLRAPVLGDVTPAIMRDRGRTAPLHPGAEAAFARGASGG